MNPLKRTLASAFEITGLNAGLLMLSHALIRPHIRCVNYHEVAPEQAAAFETQLQHYAKHFAAVDKSGLIALNEDRWQNEKPGLLITFDDGLQSHVEIVAPLLEKYGMTGWFMVPAATVRNAPGAKGWEHTVSDETLDYEGLLRLDSRHVIGCHTFSHRRLESSLTGDEIEWEIPEAKRQLEAWLGHEVDVFAWVGGEEWTYSAAAAKSIRDAGFRISFMTNNALLRPGDNLLQIQRTNIEANYPAAVARFSLSGFFDLSYGPKRRRVNRTTA